MNSSTKIICKKNQLKNGLYPIYLRVTINRKSKFYSTPFCCKLSEWDENQGEFKSKYTNAQSFNKTLWVLKDKASDVISTLEKEYETNNLVLFDKYYSKKDHEGIGFRKLFEKEIKTFFDNDQIKYAISKFATFLACLTSDLDGIIIWFWCELLNFKIFVYLV